MLQMSVVETTQMAALATEDMSAVETGPMSAAETGQMSAVETRQMSAAETGQMSAVPESSGFAWACGSFEVAPAGVYLGGRSPRRGEIVQRIWTPSLF